MLLRWQKLQAPGGDFIPVLLFWNNLGWLTAQPREMRRSWELQANAKPEELKQKEKSWKVSGHGLSVSVLSATCSKGPAVPQLLQQTFRGAATPRSGFAVSWEICGTHQAHCPALQSQWDSQEMLRSFHETVTGQH